MLLFAFVQTHSLNAYYYDQRRIYMSYSRHLIQSNYFNKRELDYNSTSLNLSGNHHIPHCYLEISPKNLIRHIDTFIPLKKPFINKDTFLIYSLFDNQETVYNTLLFQVDGSSFKSKETTKTIMERFCKSNVPYNTIRLLGKALDIHQKCPYVLGDVQFAPDRGTTKQYANWIGMHHVINIESSAESSLLHLTNHHELLLSLSFKSLLKIVENTAKLYHAQYNLSKEWEDLFIEKLPSDYPVSIIKKMHVDSLSLKGIPSPISWHTKLAYSISQNVILDIIEDGDPYLDQIKEAFSNYERESSEK